MCMYMYYKVKCCMVVPVLKSSLSLPFPLSLPLPIPLSFSLSLPLPLPLSLPLPLPPSLSLSPSLPLSLSPLVMKESSSVFQYSEVLVVAMVLHIPLSLTLSSV